MVEKTHGRKMLSEKDMYNASVKGKKEEKERKIVKIFFLPGGEGREHGKTFDRVCMRVCVRVRVRVTVRVL